MTRSRRRKTRTRRTTKTNGSGGRPPVSRAVVIVAVVTGATLQRSASVVAIFSGTAHRPTSHASSTTPAKEWEADQKQKSLAQSQEAVQHDCARQKNATSAAGKCTAVPVKQPVASADPRGRRKRNFRSTPSDCGALSMWAVNDLQLQCAIGPCFKRVHTMHRYPPDLTGLRKCHLCAL